MSTFERYESFALSFIIYYYYFLYNLQATNYFAKKKKKAWLTYGTFCCDASVTFIYYLFLLIY